MSKAKSTSPKWPDPTDWAKRLYERLEIIGAGYQAAPLDAADDPEEFSGRTIKQARAAEALLEVSAALRELPPFQKSKGAAILHDVAGALADVVSGSAPLLFTSVCTGSPGGDGIPRNYVKVWVVTSVRLLIEAHELKETKALKIVREIFAKAGATGRKGAPLSASTIRDWCEKAHLLASNETEAWIGREVARHLDEYRDLSGWPGTYDAAISWIDEIASDPLLKCKYR